MKDKRKEISAEERLYISSQWQLMWRKFIKHKLANFGGIILVIFYIIAIFCEFFSPYGIYKRYPKYMYCPPQRIHFFDEEGFHLRPFVYGLKGKLDPKLSARHMLRIKLKNIPFIFLSMEMNINFGTYFG